MAGAGAASIAFINTDSLAAAVAASGNTTLASVATANSTITGAVSHVFSQASNEAGTHAITNVVTASLNAPLPHVTTTDFNTLAAAPNGAILHLSDQTTIHLHGVKSVSPNASIAGHTA
jgi:hypothetical protein